MSPTNHRRGTQAEDRAAWWLRLKGYSILARRYRAGRGSGGGEIDIVARRGAVIAFVEVKARSDADLAALAITPAQTRRIARGAEIFLAEHPELDGLTYRFDAILMAPGRLPRHIADAWRLET
ncbi:MAG: YraN family protein [Alphaproteobacteria bacterium]|nr:YraN family protein [Alphaproteobacteria bacterium]